MSGVEQFIESASDRSFHPLTSWNTQDFFWETPASAWCMGRKEKETKKNSSPERKINKETLDLQPPGFKNGFFFFNQCIYCTISEKPCRVCNFPWKPKKKSFPWYYRGKRPYLCKSQPIIKQRTRVKDEIGGFCIVYINDEQWFDITQGCRLLLITLSITKLGLLYGGLKGCNYVIRLI